MSYGNFNCKLCGQNKREELKNLTRYNEFIHTRFDYEYDEKKNYVLINQRPTPRKGLMCYECCKWFATDEWNVKRAMNQIIPAYVHYNNIVKGMEIQDDKLTVDPQSEDYFSGSDIDPTDSGSP